MSGSTVTVIGASRPLRDAQVVWPDEDQYRYEGNVYVGGQGPRSFDIAWQIIDRLTHLGEYADADAPSACASARFGNCVHVRLHKQHDRAFWRVRPKAGR